MITSSYLSFFKTSSTKKLYSWLVKGMMQETKTVVIRSKILRITVKLDNSRAIIYFIDRVQTKTVRYLTFGNQAEWTTGFFSENQTRMDVWKEPVSFIKHNNAGPQINLSIVV